MNTLLDYSKHTIEELASLVNNGLLSATEIARSCIENIKNKQPIYNIFTQVDEQFILSQAKQIDYTVKSKRFAGKLAGVPIAIKDNIHVSNLKTTCSSKMLIDYHPMYDATVVATLKKEGAIIVGKTNMDEFAAGSSTNTSCFGATANPWGKGLSPGGSSGGSAVAASLNIVPVALGSDTGGSVRQPASLTGTIGFKPSYCSISRHGMVPLASSLDTVGIFANKITDIKYMSNILYHKCDKDVLSQEKSSLCCKVNKKIKLAVLDVWLDKETKKKMKEAISLLNEHPDITVNKIKIPSLRLCTGAYMTICCSELFTNIARLDNSIIKGQFHEKLSYAKSAIKERSEKFNDEVKSRCIAGGAMLISKTEHSHNFYELARKAQSLVASDFNQALSEYDGIISATTPIHKIFIDNASNPNTKKMLDPAHHPDALATPANLAKSPSINIPYAFSDSGTPLGMLINCAKYNDGKTLEIADKLLNIFNYNVLKEKVLNDEKRK